MASQVFYRKWRPQTLAEIVGQEAVTQTLRHALSSGRVSHAYLFCGPRGTGKTSTGRILAKAVNCVTNGKGEPCNSCQMCQAITEGRALDVIEIDAASNRGIDEIRSLRERVNYAPNQARFKVYIIDEVHMLTKEASNALLKTLEEPPAHAIFILATTEIHKVLPTIMSRCQHFDFRRLSQPDVVAKLAQICQAEGIKIETEGLRLIARAATGSLRDAENLLEQMTTYYGSEIGLSQVQAILGISGDWRAKEIVKHIINNNVAAGMSTINSVNSDGLDLRQFNREVVEYLRGLLLIKTGADDSLDFTAEDKAELKELAAKAPLSHILKAVKQFGELNLGFHNYSTLPLELALVDCITFAKEKKEEAASPVEPEVKKPVKAVTPSAAVKTPPVKSAEPSPAAKAPAAKEPPAPRPAAPQAAPVPSAANGDAKDLTQTWRQIIEQAPEETKRTQAIAILKSGVRLVSIEGDTVVLAFRYTLHKENMEKMENQKVAIKILSRFLGRPCQLRYISETEGNHLLKAALRIGAEIINVEEK